MPREEMDVEQRAGTISAQLRRAYNRMFMAARDVRLLFWGDGHATAPKPEAVRWLDRLARDNFVRSSAFHEDAREHARREGRRELALEIIASVKLDPVRLDQLAEQMREIEG
jgi:hypothetical protein